MTNEKLPSKFESSYYDKKYFADKKGKAFRRPDGTVEYWGYKNPKGEWLGAKKVAEAWKTMLQPKNILDIGCGRGVFIAYARDVDIEAEGFDFSEWAIKNPYSRCKKEWLKLHDATKPWPYKDNSFDLVTALDFCLVPDTLIETSIGLKAINQIEVGEYVLTHKGRFRQVTKRFERIYDGMVIRLKPRFFGEILITPEHPVLAIKNPYKRKGLIWKNAFFKGRPTHYNSFKLRFEWVKASDLSKDDLILYPIVRDTKNIKSIKISEVVENDGYIKEEEYLRYRHKPHNRIKDEILINLDLMRLLGYFLADGSVAKNDNYVQFHINKSDTTMLKDIENILKILFGLEAHRIPRKGRIQLACGSRLLAQLFRVFFGKNPLSHTKSIPEWIMKLPRNKQRELIKGMWMGDGSIGNKSFQYVTTSEKLAHQLQMLLMRQGIISTLNRYENKSDFSDKYNTKDVFHLDVCGIWLEKMSKLLAVKHPYLESRSNTRRHGLIFKDYAIVPIRSVGTAQYKGKVYNLAIEDDNSYTTTAGNIHNCEHVYQSDLDFVVSEMYRVAKKWVFLQIATVDGVKEKGYILKRGEPIPLELEGYAVAGHVTVQPESFWYERLDDENWMLRRDMVNWFISLVPDEIIKNWLLSTIIVMSKIE